jgi:hypothetical protein
LQIEQFPADLQAVIWGWGSLPKALKAAIVLIVERGRISGSD